MDTTHVLTPRGRAATLLTRPTTSDLSLAGAFFEVWGKIDDEYRLADLRVDGVFVDIGAHIGLVSLSVLLDNPGARAICVEPLADNCELLARNADVNGVRDRVTILCAGIGRGSSVGVPWDYATGSTAYNDSNRYIGALAEQASAALSVATVPTVTLASLVRQAGGEIDAMKLDCEGCEWRVLASPAVRNVRVIFGEWHGHAIRHKQQGAARLRELLGATHDVEVLRDFGGTGDFRAVRR